jgi:hypothetical protein
LSEFPVIGTPRAYGVRVASLWGVHKTGSRVVPSSPGEEDGSR